MPVAPPGIGIKLRNARLDRDLSIEETAWRTRIRPDLLRALEEDEFAEIGHRAFVRGHLSSYARFLGIDPDEVCTDLDHHLEPAPSAIEELERRRRSARKPPRPKWLVAAALSGTVLIAAAIAGVLGGQAERPAADLPDPSTLPIATADDPVPPALARVRLRIEAAEETQVSVLVDGDEVFEGLLAAGESRTFRAADAIEVLAANGGTILVGVNGGDLAVAGDAGLVFRARYGPRGRLDR